MAAKKLTLACTEQEKTILCEAIRLYAEAAYPPGGSQCAQVARETLLDAVRSIDEQFASKGQAEVSRRLRAQFKSALEYFENTANINNNDDAFAPVLQLKAVLTTKSQD